MDDHFSNQFVGETRGDDGQAIKIQDNAFLGFGKHIDEVVPDFLAGRSRTGSCFRLR